MTCPCKIVKDYLYDSLVTVTPSKGGSIATPAFCSTTYQTICMWKQKGNLEYEWVQDKNGEYHYVPKLSLSPDQWLVYAGALSYYGCETHPYTTCYPATTWVDGFLGGSSLSQLAAYKNFGWNSSCRAINALAVDTSLSFTVANGVMGLFIGLDVAGRDGQPTWAFPYGIMVDANGAHVYESGAVVNELAAAYTADTMFKVERKLNAGMEYITYFADSASYASLVNPGSGDVLIPYLYLYSSGDALLCAEYKTLLGGSSNGVSVIADKTMSANMEFGLLVSGSSGLGDFAIGQMYLPELYAEGVAGGYVPVMPDTATLSTGFFVAQGLMIEVDYMHGDMKMPAFVSQGIESGYDAGYLTMPAMFAKGVDGAPLNMIILSGMYCTSQSTMLRDLVFVMLSEGSLVSIQAIESIFAAEYMSQLRGASVQDMLADMGVTMMSGMTVHSVQVMAMPAGPALNGFGRVWVVNLDTAAAGQYDAYAFNSFFVRDGRQYGVANDGIYLLEGDDDAGTPIQALMELGMTDFGASQAKLVPSIYLGVASTGAMVLKVVADGQSHFYTARSASTDLKNHRVDTGRGLKGVNWSFALLNQDGGEFDLAAIEFVSLATKRRI